MVASPSTEQLLFGRRVREYRKQKGFTLKQVAAKVGKTETSLSRVERGKQNLTFLDIAALAEVLQVPIASLFGATATTSMLTSLVTQCQSLLLQLHTVCAQASVLDEAIFFLQGDIQNTADLSWKNYFAPAFASDTTSFSAYALALV